LHGTAALTAQGLQAALPATGFFAAQGFWLCADRLDELPAASATPMLTMSGKNVVDSSFLLSGSMADGLLVFELRTSGSTMGI
jgi:putative intracellular protease/amidase